MKVFKIIFITIALISFSGAANAAGKKNIKQLSRQTNKAIQGYNLQKLEPSERRRIRKKLKSLKQLLIDFDIIGNTSIECRLVRDRYFTYYAGTNKVIGSSARAAGHIRENACKQTLPEYDGQKVVCLRYAAKHFFPTFIKSGKVKGSTSSTAAFRTFQACHRVHIQ